jgi:hypothetical protein
VEALRSTQVEAGQLRVSVAHAEEERALTNLRFKIHLFKARHHPCVRSVTELVVTWVAFRTRALDSGRHYME